VEADLQAQTETAKAVDKRRKILIEDGGLETPRLSHTRRFGASPQSPEGVFGECASMAVGC